MLIALVVRVALAFRDPAPIGAAVLRAAVARQPLGPLRARPRAHLHRRDGRQPRAGALCGHGRRCRARTSRPRARRDRVRTGRDARTENQPVPGRVVRLVATARVLGVDEFHWPKLLRDEIIGRVLGRVLAHEIGHYALRRRQHGGEGLMRSIQRADELAALSRKGFRLSASEGAHLSSRAPWREVVMKKKGPAHPAGPGGEAQPDAAPTRCGVLMNAR